MDLVRPRQAYGRIDDFLDHGPIAEDSITLTTFTSESAADAESDNSWQLGYRSTCHLQPSAPPLRDPVKQSTTTALSGWRLGAWAAGCLATVSLVINLAAAIYLATHPDAQTSLVEVYKGDCDTVKSLDLWIHLLINAISTLLLGGSNYCMQCLLSPSRDELDRAHAKGIPLDIGVPSPRNQFAVGKLKRLLWWILALSSIPLHLMYNSAFYTAIGARDYDLYVVQPDFFTGQVTYDPKDQIFNTSRTDSSNTVADPRTVYQNYTRSTQFHNFTNLDCMTTYAKVISTDWSTLLLVTRNSSNNNSVVAATSYEQQNNVNPNHGSYSPYDWVCRMTPVLTSIANDREICSSYPSFTSQTHVDSTGRSSSPSCDEYISKVEATAAEWMVLNESIDYCLAERAEQRCSLNGNLPIILVVIICNLIKAIVTMYVAARLPGRPLITIGDAIQSFLEKPDPTTKGLCWITRRQILDYATYTYHFPQASWPADAVNARVEPHTVSLRDRRWFNAAGHTRWVSTIMFLCLALAVSISLFVFGYANIYGDWASNTTNQTIKQLGFGALQPLTVISGLNLPPSPAGQILVSVLVANSPQVVLSFLYLNLNGLMTSMWLADEWHRFATQRKYLRVSSPKGKQRSTHFLQLPYKISIPLMVTSGLLHWLLSRSIFLAVVSEYDAVGDLINPVLIASCGYSLLPILVTVVFGFVLMFMTLALGFRRYDGRIPLVGSCSAAISAACHRPDWDTDAALRPLKYGQVLTRPGLKSNDNDVGHCCFTSAEVEFAVEGKLYAGCD